LRAGSAQLRRHHRPDRRPERPGLPAARHPGQAEISASQDGPRFDVTTAEHRLVTGKFIAASARGDLDELLKVLAPDAWGDIDYGPAVARPHIVVTGAERVARLLLDYGGPGATLVSHPVGGQPALLGFHDRELSGVLVFTMRGETIQAVHVIVDPAKLGFLRLQLASPA
jgi:RNA polymerase sigma-70 factor (ECF subfamily)